MSTAATPASGAGTITTTTTAASTTGADGDDAAIPAELRDLRTVHGRIGSVHRLVDGMLEVTLTGFPGYPSRGGDEFVYTMVSTETGGIRPDYGIADVRRQDPADRVRGAYYTIRSTRPERGEIVLWVVDHGHAGSVADWMASAQPGDPVALWGPRRGFELPADVQDLLLVADETGLAAVASLLHCLPADRWATAVLECASPCRRPPLPRHPGLEVHWIDRGSAAPGSHDRLLDATIAVLDDARARGLQPPDAAFGAGATPRIARVHRHLRDVVGIPAERMHVTGYWRRRPCSA